jgi:hypothetical protein
VESDAFVSLFGIYRTEQINVNGMEETRKKRGRYEKFIHLEDIYVYMGNKIVRHVKMIAWDGEKWTGLAEW